VFLVVQADFTSGGVWQKANITYAIRGPNSGGSPGGRRQLIAPTGEARAQDGVEWVPGMENIGSGRIQVPLDTPI
jgi:hypothetical protein